MVSPKDPRAATLNAKLAGLVTKVEKAALHAAAHEEAFVPPIKPKRAKSELPKPVVAQQFYEQWLAENPGLSASSNRRYKQVVAHLEAYRADWAITTLTRKEFLEYMAHVAGLGLVDSATIKHVKFLCECFRLALQAAELRQLIALPLFEQDTLEVERDMFLLQTLLLRDSDLR